MPSDGTPPSNTPLPTPKSLVKLLDDVYGEHGLENHPDCKEARARVLSESQEDCNDIYDNPFSLGLSESDEK